MSDPETLIQSQQVTLTGPEKAMRWLLQWLNLAAEDIGFTVTIVTPSVTDAAVGVTQDSQQNPRQQFWACGRCGYPPETHGLVGHPTSQCIYEPVLLDAQGSVTEQSQQKSRQDAE